MQWGDNIQFLKGVGPQRAKQFEKLGVSTAGDLLRLFPRTYIDYSNPTPISAAPFDAPCVVQAEILAKHAGVRVSGGRTIFKVDAADATASLEIVFFNNPYGVKKLEVGQSYRFYGKLGGGFSSRSLISPVFIAANAAAPLTAVYPLTEGLSNYAVSRCVASALEQVTALPEPLPKELLQLHKMPDIKTALSAIHLPTSQSDATAARRRFIFEELFCLQLGMLLLRGRNTAAAGAPMKAIDLGPFVRSLPFTYTNAQAKAAQEICADMCAPTPANRLLQGDVGSGKTAVAAAGIYTAAKNGYQSVLMAPTEILAKQHAETLQKLFAPHGISVALLTGSVKGKARTAVLKAIAGGEATLVVGTHAVLSEPVQFAKLGFAVTDEQHRFGVRQRGLLAGKATRPHLLVMSATPIPRTLALLMFGDLDISIINELPPGRTPVKTRIVPVEKRADMFGFLKQQVKEGRQVYIVCPLIDENPDEASSAAELQAATQYARQIATPLLPGVNVGLMHGKLKAAEKAEIMRAFKEREIDVLVSTTVIEVGVDVPNASVMVVEDAERYGLSALHQLRGRVGRGSAESWCFLVSGHTGSAAQQRLQYLCTTQDGFAVARYDLETRGPGDFFGSRQHGLPTLRIASLSADSETLQAAQQQATATLKQDPKLQLPQHTALAEEVVRLFQNSAVMN